MIAALRVLALWVVLAAGFVPAAFAQSGSPDYDSWDTVAARAEEAVQNASASDGAFEALRQQLVIWRTEFQRGQATNAAPISAVQAQIDALGPKPAEGEEAADTARQREELNTRLNELRAPIRRAEVAYSRADALIQQIDRILRERQANQLLELGPTPINPVGWPSAAEALADFFYRAAMAVNENWHNETRRAAFRRNLPATILLLTLAFVLTVRGRYWVELLVNSVQDRSRTAERWLAGLVMSLGQIILPVVGLLLFSVAATSTQLLGARGDMLMQVLPAAGFEFFAARWLGLRMFPRGTTFEPPLTLSPVQQAEGRLHASILGLVLLLAAPLRAMRDFAGWSPEIANVVFFPLLIVAGLSLLRLGQLLGSHAKTQLARAEDSDFRTRIVGLLARAIMVFAVAGPALAGIGYFNAGEAVVFPTISTLMLLALLTVLQRVIIEVYILFTRNRDGVSEALTPVLGGFVLALLSLPAFALIWGARITDLTEIWARFRAGFAIGDTRISPTDFLTFVLIFALGYVLTRLLQGTLRTTVLPKTRLDPGGQNAVVSGTGYVGIFIAAIVAVTSAGLDLSSLAIVAGALSVGIGFGLQNIVSNFVSGIILLIERPISIGDWIEVGGKMGFVRDISVRSTRIETFDRTDVIVPNADLVSGTVTNWTRGNMVGRIIVPVGVAYGSDTRQVEKILREVAEAQPMVLLNPPPFVLFGGFGADSLNFEVRAILRDITASLVVQTEMNHQITERFRAAGIEIPFAQRDIWLRNPEVLTGHRPGGPGQDKSADNDPDKGQGEATPFATATNTAPPAPQRTETAAQHMDADDLPGHDDGDADGER